MDKACDREQGVRNKKVLRLCGAQLKSRATLPVLSLHLLPVSSRSCASLACFRLAQSLGADEDELRLAEQAGTGAPKHERLAVQVIHVILVRKRTVSTRINTRRAPILDVPRARTNHASA